MAFMKKSENTLLPPDLHIHTTYSRHAEGSMEEMVLSAVRIGLSEIGFADHFPYPKGFQEPVPNCVIPDEEVFELYVKEVRRLQQAYRGRISILFGTEIDYLPDHLDDIRNRLEQYPFDYVIGSIHLLNGIAIDYREEALQSRIHELGGPEGLWEKYWMALEHFCSLDLFHIVGHFDLPRKFGITRVQNGFSEATGRVLDRILQKDLALEVNTGGIDRSADHACYPSETILKQAIRMGVDISFGSDAHRPREAGRHFSGTIGQIRSLGCLRAVTFRSKKKQYVPLKSNESRKSP